MNSPLVTPVDPFSLDLPSTLHGRAAAYVARPLLSWLLNVEALRDVYQAARLGHEEAFAERVLKALSIDVDAAPSELANIPASGPVIVAANHPRGALDGLSLAALVRTVRPDVRLLANYLLDRIPELRPSCFFVDPFEGPMADARSRAGLRAAHLWLRRGGALIMFPAGEVSHRRDASGRLFERKWDRSLGRLAMATGATVVPATIHGENSSLFYAAGRLHPALRTALLPRELLAARGSRVAISIHPAMTPAAGPTALTRCSQQAAGFDACPSDDVADELARLPRDATLIESGRCAVFCAAATDIPRTLQEIGRLRAVTYRAAGEGTGADVDLDEFDRHYLHLFTWDRDARCVVGAYRIGRTDRLVGARGVEALYTRTLFDYGRELIDAMAPALELGRAFVRPEYQRHPQALFLLWRGIGAFVVRHPEYRLLFGPVSISGRYCDASLSLLTAFLEQNHLDSRLAGLVTPRHPRPAGLDAPPSPITASDTDRLVARLEADGKGMPVLLRQYLKLNARALGVSVDPAFGDVVDALMAIDLTRVDPSILRRYLGTDGVATYQRHHQPRDVAAA